MLDMRLSLQPDRRKARSVSQTAYAWTSSNGQRYPI
jgi:hypothetical protein